MRRSLRRLLAASFLAVVMLAVSIGVAAAAGPVPLDQLQKGDILFMRNPSDMWSAQTYWTHNGMYIGAYKGDNGRGVQVDYKYAVIEAISPRVTILDLSNPKHWYYSTTYSVGVERFAPNGVSDPVTAGLAADRAKYYKGRAYEFPLFTRYGGKDTPNALYCSELIWRAFMDVNPAIDLDRTPNTLIWGKNVVTPDDEYYNDKYLRPVGTPILRYAPLAK